MPNNISSETNTQGAVSVLPNESKTVCIVATGGTAPTINANEIVDIVSTVDAENKLGSDATAVDLVRILINNKVSKIKCIMLDDTIVTEVDRHTASLDELLNDKDIKIIITDVVDQTVYSAYTAHLDLAEEEELFRYAVLGIASGSDNLSLGTYAGSINHKRIFIPGPSVLDTSGTALDGIYAAAGISALISTETSDPALPMSGVEINGFGGIERVLLKADKTALADNGIIPLYANANGNPTVYRLVTTYTKDSEGNDDITWQEGTTIFISDDVMESVQARIRSNYQRTKNVARILDSIRTDVIDVLQIKNDLEIIENFDPNTVTVVKDPTDLYGALIDYEYDVVTPLYNLTIRQSMKL